MEAPPHPEDPVTYMYLNKAKTPVSDDHDDHFGVPTLEELGMYY